MTSDRATVYASLDSERAYQIKKAEGVRPDAVEMPKTLEQYLIYMDDYTRELKTQISRTWTPDGTVPASLHTLRKVTALGVAAMEHCGAPTREDEENAKIEASRP